MENESISMLNKIVSDKMSIYRYFSMICIYKLFIYVYYKIYVYFLDYMR